MERDTPINKVNAAGSDVPAECVYYPDEQVYLFFLLFRLCDWNDQSDQICSHLEKDAIEFSKLLISPNPAYKSDVPGHSANLHRQALGEAYIDAEVIEETC